MQVQSYGFSYDGANVQQSAGRFRYGEGEAEEAPPFTGSHVVFAWAGVGGIFLCLPALVELSVYGLERNAMCDQPLAMWLLVDGTVALCLFLLSLTLAARILLSAGDEEMSQTRTEQAATGETASAHVHAKRRELTSFENGLLRIQRTASVLPLLLLLAGLILCGADVCDEQLLWWTRGIVHYKVGCVLMSCCCCIPCVLCCGALVGDVVGSGRLNYSSVNYSAAAQVTNAGAQRVAQE